MKDIKTLLNEATGSRESFEVPLKLIDILLDDKKRTELLDNFTAEFKDFSRDWFTDYFQTEQSDRKELMQDFTPDSLCAVISGIAGKADTIADICSGCGGLAIKVWNNNKDSYFHCEEYSNRALPFLLFNLAVRNIEGDVFHGDALTRKAEALYKLRKGEKYSTIEKVESLEDRKFKAVIMNPPYSQKWTPPLKEDERFKEYGLAPKAKADFAFLLHGLSLLEDGGVLQAILPHGVLFRGQSEATIRQNLVENQKLYALVSFPASMFLNTSIPTVDMVLKANSHNTLIIDTSKNCTKGKKQNTLNDEQIEKVVSTYKDRKDVQLYARIVKPDEFKENGYNLNIPRYVNTEEAEEEEDLEQILKDLSEAREAEKTSMKSIVSMMKNIGYSPTGDPNTSPEKEAEEAAKAERELSSWMTYLEKEAQAQPLDIYKQIVEEFGGGKLDNRCFQTPITDLFDIERAKNGKVYKAGTIAIQVSATKGQTYMLTNDEEVEAKYAVLTPTMQNPFYDNWNETCYCYYAFTQQLPEIFRVCKQDLNINVEELKRIRLLLHFSERTRHYLGSLLWLVYGVDDRGGEG